MASTDGIVIDLNDPRTLELYSQILLFKNDPSQEFLVFPSPDKAKQRILQSLAHKLDLECEYALATRSLTISRPAPEDWIDPEATYDTEAVDNLLEDVGGVFGDALHDTGMSFSPFFGDDFSFDIPQPGMDASVSGTLDNSFRCSASEAANVPVFGPDVLLFHVEDGVPAAPNQTPLDSARTSSIVLQNERSAPSYSEELDLSIEGFSTAAGRGLFPGSDVTGPPFDLEHPLDQSFEGHEKNKQKSALDMQRSRKRSGAGHSNKFHTPVSIPECQGTLLLDIPKEPEISSLQTEGQKSSQGLPQQTHSSKPLSPTELLWDYCQIPRVNAIVPSMVSRLNADDSAECEAIRATNALPSSSEEGSKKRKNAERSVSPILNAQTSPTTYPEGSISVHGRRPRLGPPKPTFLENVHSKIERIIRLQSPYKQTFSEKSSLELHIDEDHSIGAKFNGTAKNVAYPPTSANSCQSTRGRSGFRNPFSMPLERSPSPSPVPSPMPSPRGYEEIVFDARSDQSSGHASLHSNASRASGRRGPLNDAARAGMCALKDIGACWRCKFLRKPCDPDARCGWCPRPKEGSSSEEVLSAWAALGCQRGTFQSVTPFIVLCPKSFTILSSDYDHQKGGPHSILDVSRWMAARQLALDRANRLWRTALLKRDKALKGIGNSITGPEGGLSPHNRQLQKLFSVYFPGSIFSNSTGWEHAPAQIPLNECILAIAWESPTSELESLARLLPQAAAHQAVHENDRLIAQSLICLRSCLEATRMKSSYDKYGALPHDRCVVAACQIECIAELKANISLYLEELSRVFFKKSNMLAKEHWWLSTFYGFCIQSRVKKLLIALETEQSDGGFDTCREYLQLPIKLFIAVSNKYDPLLVVALESTYINERIAVDAYNWEANGISGSADYLRKLFANSGRMSRRLRLSNTAFLRRL